MPSEVWKKMQANISSPRLPNLPIDPLATMRQEDEKKRVMEQETACENIALTYVMEALGDIKTYEPRVSRARKSILYPPRKIARVQKYQAADPLTAYGNEQNQHTAYVIRLSWGDWNEGVEGNEKCFIVRIGNAIEKGEEGIERQIAIYHGKNEYEEGYKSFDEFNANGLYSAPHVPKAKRVYLGRNDTNDFLVGNGKRRLPPRGFNLFPNEQRGVFYPQEITIADPGEEFKFVDWFAGVLQYAIFHPIVINHLPRPPIMPHEPKIGDGGYGPDWRQ